MIDFKYQNNDSKGYDFTDACRVNVWQGGRELDSDPSKNKDTWERIKDGASLDVTKAYMLRDKQEIVEVDLDEWFAFDSKPLKVYFNPQNQKWGSKNDVQSTEEDKNVLAEKTDDQKENVEGWVCSSCGKTLTSKFCPDCGTTSPTPAPSPTPSPESTPDPVWICPNCGVELESKFCPECGATKPSVDDSDIGVVEETFTSPLIVEMMLLDSNWAPIDNAIVKKEITKSGKYTMTIKAEETLQGINIWFMSIDDQDDKTADSTNLKDRCIRIDSIMVDGKPVKFNKNATCILTGPIEDTDIKERYTLSTSIYSEYDSDVPPEEYEYWDGDTKSYEANIVDIDDFETYNSVDVVFTYGKFEK